MACDRPSTTAVLPTPAHRSGPGCSSAAGEDLHHPLDLALAADDRVELLVTGELREVAAELIETIEPGHPALAGRASGCRRRCPPCSRTGAGSPSGGRGSGRRRASGAPGRRRLRLADQAEQDVFGADVVVAELERLAQGQLEDLLGRGVNGTGPSRRLALADDLSTCWRTASREMFRDSSAFAATPSPSSVKPRRMCSVPCSCR